MQFGKRNREEMTMLFFKKIFLFYVPTYGYYVIKAKDESEATYKLCHSFLGKKFNYEVIKNYAIIK